MLAMVADTEDLDMAGHSWIFYHTGSTYNVVVVVNFTMSHVNVKVFTSRLDVFMNKILEFYTSHITCR